MDKARWQRAHTRNLGAACIVASVAACTPARTASNFGPPEPAPSHATPTVPTPRPIARGYAPSWTIPFPKALELQQTRLDELDAQVQNWEIELELASTDPARPDNDELLAAWMTGRPGLGGRTSTELVAARSTDSARTFSRMDLQIPLPAPSIPFDPTIEFDRIANKAYISAMGQAASSTRSIWFAASPDGDNSTFAPGVIIPNVEGEFPDKGWFASGPAPGDPSRSVLYLATRSGVRTSPNDGATWSAPVLLSQQSNLLQPLVLPDGTLIVSYLGVTGQALFSTSQDAGESFSAPVAIHTFVGTIGELTNPVLPGSFRSPPTTMIARDPRDGRLYAVLNDVARRNDTEADVDVLLFESTDDGRTWSSGRNITADLPPFSDQFMPWLAVDGAGRLHFAYFDSSRHLGTDASPSALIDVWYAQSLDRGQTWNRVRLTGQPIDSQHTRWSPTSNAVDAQFLGDYITAVASDHAAYVAHPVFESGVYGMAISKIETDAPAATAIRDLRGLTGIWYDPARSGQGFEFVWLADGALAATFYGHRDDGSNLFLVGLRTGQFAYTDPLQFTLTVTRGGRFTNFNPATIQNSPWGTLTLKFDSCNTASAILNGLDGTQTFALVPLARQPNLPCD